MQFGWLSRDAVNYSVELGEEVRYPRWFNNLVSIFVRIVFFPIDIIGWILGE